MRIAETAIAATREPRPFAHPLEVGDQRLIVRFKYLSAGRHFEHEIGGIGAGALPAHSANTRLGLEMLLVAVVDERIQAVDRFDPDIAAPPAVAPVRPAEFDELLASEAYSALAAVARAHIDLRLIE